MDYWDRLREQQDYFDRMHEIRSDLEWRLKQDEITRELEQSILDSKAREKEVGAMRQKLRENTHSDGASATASAESLANEIWLRYQEVLAILRESDLAFPYKENWIKRLSSENWRAELDVLQREVDIDRNTPVTLRQFFKADLYSPSTWATADMNLNRLDTALCLLGSSLLMQRVLN